MSSLIKQIAARSRLKDQIKQEASIYEDAIKSGSKFSDYYQSKLDKLNVSLAELNSSAKK
jgi:hypothetical protein|tara:strand:+ start:240 stop:419 length:180 start_codon:yes stop_codon:yes gene_type:complete